MYCMSNLNQVPEQYGPIRVLTQGKGNLILAGTTRNSILQGSLDLKFSSIVQVWGVSVLGGGGG